MGKLEDMERRISGLERDVYDLKFPPKPLRLTAQFTDGPLRGETRQVFDLRDYLAPMLPTGHRAWDARPDIRPLHMIAVYQPFRRIRDGVWEYRVRGYECSGGH